MPYVHVTYGDASAPLFFRCVMRLCVPMIPPVAMNPFGMMLLGVWYNRTVICKICVLMGSDYSGEWYAHIRN